MTAAQAAEEKVSALSKEFAQKATVTGRKLTKEEQKAAKKAAKKQERAKLAEESRRISSTLSAARFAEDGTTPRDHLENFAAFAKFDRNGLQLTLKAFARGAEGGVPPEVLKACFDMTEANMKASYEESGWGWNALKKQRELESEEARLLVAFDTDDVPRAFLHFRFEREEDQLVLYVYEVQVDQATCARKGVGRHIMLLAELIARRAGMDWVCLTVLNCNEAAAKFYERLGYKMDETSPQVSQMEGEEDASYTILSKRCGAKPATASA
ncbi:N-alpha-acetyltransferase 40 [Hondaea fermentalgiana]|uniref:N-alpha-acetyltransferase 40 n=1 Tax=Hondaea fermentalgiana TaxID=2315210 RepID=A0A2R5GP30_9STRA|nr:N-alpha-acetyltransferase 40 [Hondaea fermentalgiana]|eukprot:GBG32059.1 N-alpha-acetyltransferase 40 [Hondaea fermentalgiana]